MDPSDLYGLPLERFTEERNSLAAQLRRGGQRDEAARVAKLRKPSVAAWAVNQVVRSQRREVAALFAAGDAVHRAQEDLLGGRGDPGPLREAVDSERAAVARLADTARGLLSGHGHELTQARLEQVSETLHAAAFDQDARAQVKDGCLQRELRHVGLGGSPAETPAPRNRRATGGRRKAAGEVKAARKAESEAKRDHERAARELAAAEERRRRAADDLREAEAALAGARERSEEAARAHERTRKALEDLG